LLIAAY